MTPECENEWVSGSCACSWNLHLLLDCHVLIGHDNFCIILFLIFYFFMVSSHIFKDHPFLMRDRNGVSLKGREGRNWK